jgi:hypothetical protein
MIEFDEIILNILCYCDYSPNIRCSRQFRKLTNYVFEYRFKLGFHIYYNYKSLDKLEYIFPCLSTKSLNELIIECDCIKLREMIIYSKNYDPFYNNSEIIFILCKCGFDITLEKLITRYDYDESVIKECIDKLKNYLHTNINNTLNNKYPNLNLKT